MYNVYPRVLMLIRCIFINLLTNDLNAFKIPTTPDAFSPVSILRAARGVCKIIKNNDFYYISLFTDLSTNYQVQKQKENELYLER